ncbi:ASN_HP2_G0038920.mRNA.1.CDS.1 [Saccharomyces cerevisiae]|nr:BGP_1a_G0040340.mRNA.1.CDS.1 [Saccharomyces cerevisiae]CAI5286350.1 ASN_HP2_G0038920.mRNA.1.CDS.1 [Saccharomyces cerevisiae]CAI5311915.1 BFH_HP2_G0040030.mRNA.1.CDS.1 [Saccharomyces cerevisiae]CAI6574294.1 ASN_HP2_G0038920.mRNA.1.CDS.1 [Saccharomyces cerevisiae]CAI6610303.1 ASN_HP1_G0039870.mRNA.1.CDS.1 [Saccharomyces cerevisiae]
MSTTGPLDATLIRDVAVATATKASYDMSDTLYSYLPKVDQFYIPEWLTMQFIANNLISFTPLFSYGTTIISIEKCKTALGFSIDICATMLIASILRISYYLITPYEITLLRQSLVMIFIQLILLRTSLKYRPDEYKYQNLTDVESLSHLIHDIWFEFFSCINRPKFLSEDWKNLIKSLSFTNLLKFSFKIFLAFFYKILKFFDPNFKRIGAFWQWDDDKNFWRFLALFATVQILVTFFISNILNWDSLAQGLGSIIGSLGLLVESLLPLPQIAILYKLKSVQGFKLILLVSWLCGDTLKITYLIFGAKNISALFVIFALFQMSLDFYIGGQYIYYRYYYLKLRHQHHPNDSNSPSDEDESEMYELDLFNTLQKDVEKALKQDSNDTSDSPQDDQVGKSQAQAVTV